MQSHLPALLAACADTDDHEHFPWLVLADYLDEHSDPRGFLVRYSRRDVLSAPQRVAVSALLTSCGAARFGLAGSPRDLRLENGWLAGEWAGRVPQWPARWSVAYRGPVGWEATRRKLPARPPAWLRWSAEAACRGGGAGEALSDLPGLSRLRVRAWPGEPLDLPDAPDLRDLEVVGTARLAAYDVQRIAARRSLRSLTLDGVLGAAAPPLAPLARLEMLHTLRLRGARALPVSDVRALAASLRLRRLEWRGTIDPDTLGYLSAWPDLVALRLHDDAEMTPEMLGHLASLRRLECLDVALPDMPRAYDWVGSLAALPRLRRLRLASLAFGKLTDTDVAALADAPALEELDLAGNAAIGDRTLARLASVATLRRLDVTDCPRVGDAAINALRRARPRLCICV